MKRTKESLQSNAKLSPCSVMVQMDVAFEDNGEVEKAIFSKHQHRGYGIQVEEAVDGVVKNFPFIFRGNGEPWSMANQYLISDFDEKCLCTRPKISTYESKARHLTQFLRWIEDRQANGFRVQGGTLDEFTFPKDKNRRVTYIYNRYLKGCIKNGTIAPSSAKVRQSAVINFYRWVKRYYPEYLANEPFSESKAFIPANGMMGGRLHSITVTDLSIKGGRKVSPALNGEIMDGGSRLRPLNNDEQDVLQEHLALLNNWTYQLIVWVALYTGARLQTIGTLRISSLRDTYELKRKNNNGEYVIKVGAGTVIDCKYSGSDMMKSYMLCIPVSLLEELLRYADSDYARKCRVKSFYGDSDENYLFLSSKGNPYYTSDKEIADRQSDEYSRRIALSDRVGFKVTDGQSIWQWNKSLLKIIRRTNPGFRRFKFHDLRATFACNYVNEMLDAGEPDSFISQSLADRMGHANPQTSMAYVRYDRMTEAYSRHQEYHSDKVFSDVGKYSLGKFENDCE